MKYVVVIIKTDEQLTNVNQNPKQGVMLFTAAEVMGIPPLEFSDALDGARDYNAKELQHPHGTWAVILGEGEEPEPGTVVNVGDYNGVTN